MFTMRSLVVRAAAASIAPSSRTALRATALRAFSAVAAPMPAQHPHAAAAVSHIAAAPAAATPVRVGLGGGGKTFSSLGLSAAMDTAIRNEFKYELMSDVQAQCIPIALKGGDIVARARTGTGKTLAFLLPLVEHVLASRSRTGVSALIISPTRELASQIEEEAQRLCRGAGSASKLRIACFYGGTNIAAHQNKLKGGIDIVICTPGRMKDLLENTPGAVEKFKSVNQLVLDEADRLLDMGFARDLNAILARLPEPARRQTQLYSATFPPNVKEMAARCLRPSYALVNCVGESSGAGGAESTHQHVKQHSLVVPLANQSHALYELIRAHQTECASKGTNAKIIVFFTTARMTAYMSRLFTAAGMKTEELHSRLSQPKRTRVADEFRAAASGILFSSDVSARGLDFPNTSLIIQVGLTDPEQYVHRIGRTARAGKEGRGIIILADFEEKFLQVLLKNKLPVTPLLAAEAGLTAVAPAASHPLSKALASVHRDEDLSSVAAQAYRAYLGFYKGSLGLLGLSPAQLVELANRWSGIAGLKEVPEIEAKTVGMMGMKGVPGLRIVKSMSRQENRPPRNGQQQQQRERTRKW